jgi:hypothetical protein
MAQLVYETQLAVSFFGAIFVLYHYTVKGKFLANLHMRRAVLRIHGWAMWRTILRSHRRAVRRTVFRSHWRAMRRLNAKRNLRCLQSIPHLFFGKLFLLKSSQNLFYCPVYLSCFICVSHNFYAPFFEVAVIYCRRRVGKTALIIEFTKDKPSKALITRFKL